MNTLFELMPPPEGQPTQRVTFESLGLTARQGDVLGLVLVGMSNKKIAQTLGITESTVKEHMTGILERMGVSRRMEIFHLLNINRMTFVSSCTKAPIALMPFLQPSPKHCMNERNVDRFSKY
jgi:DNA-binding CsgD family transcriptional regulator